MKKQLLTVLAVVGLFSLAQNVNAQDQPEMSIPSGEVPVVTQPVALEKNGVIYKLVPKSGRGRFAGKMDLVAAEDAAKLPPSCKKPATCELFKKADVEKGTKVLSGNYTLQTEYYRTGTKDPNYVGYVAGSEKPGVGIGGNTVTAVFRLTKK